MIKEFDMDGVLVDTHAYIQKCLGFNVFDNSKKYSIDAVENRINDTIREKVYALFADPRTYEFAMPTQFAIEYLEKVSKEHDTVIHSLAYNEECRQSKLRWIERWLHGLSIDVVIDIGEKSMLKSDCVYEDCLENLKNSPAKQKILIDKPYNQERYNPEFQEVFNYHGFKRIKGFQ